MGEGRQSSGAMGSSQSISVLHTGLPGKIFLTSGVSCQNKFENPCSKTPRWRHGMCTGTLGVVLRREARLETRGRSPWRGGGSESHREQERKTQNRSLEVLTFQEWWGGEGLKKDGEEKQGSEESRKS